LRSVVQCSATSHTAAGDEIFLVGGRPGLIAWVRVWAHGNILGKAAKVGLGKQMGQMQVGCHDGCPRLPVTAARRMRWLMVRAVIEGWLERRERTLVGGRGSHLGESGRRNAELGPDAGREQAHNSGGRAVEASCALP
jgi:hypothetical protein